MAGFTAATDAGRTRAAGWLGSRAVMGLDELVSAGPELYLLTVPDHALPAVAQELAQALSRARKSQDPTGERSGPVAAHTSGATSVSVLADCEQAGAATLVFHPLQTFSDPATGRARFAGAAVALTPADGRADSAAGAMGFRLAHALGSRPFLLADAKRPLYHAAASVACNYLVTLEHHAHRLFVKAGLPEDDALSLFLPLVSATLENVARQGPIHALTGPLSRGDIHTIEAHIRALEADAPDLLPLYRSLGLATLDLVKAREDVRGSVLAELARLLRDDTQAEDPGP
jgi:predicted short-subunit dehydrogenase-like oxidoreductase (DUF2520 family)